ncbi:MAG: hypothetical protein IPJ20_12855 [Flammeovirgaceae bacterium]|nr:hypothetical protein [Flammeovirgaceae bacterium]
MHLRFLKILTVALLLNGSFCFAQNKQGTGLSISRANSVITIDGVLDEEAWATAGVASNFFLTIR